MDFFVQTNQKVQFRLFGYPNIGNDKQMLEYLNNPEYGLQNIIGFVPAHFFNFVNFLKIRIH